MENKTEGHFESLIYRYILQKLNVHGYSCEKVNARTCEIVD